MDDKQRQRVENLIAQGRSDESILDLLSGLHGLEYNDIKSYLDSKKKDQGASAQDPMEDLLVFDQQEASPSEPSDIASASAGVSPEVDYEKEVEDARSAYEATIGQGFEPGESFVQGAAYKRLKEAETRAAYGGLEQYRQFFKDTAPGLGLSEKNSNAISETAKSIVESLTPQMIEDVNNDADLKAEMDKIREEYRVGGTIKVYDTVTRGGVGGMYQDTVARDVTVTEDMLDEQIDNARKKALNDRYYETVGTDAKSQVMEMIPEELRDNEKVLEYLTDKIYTEHGIDLDLDGDGRLKDQFLLDYFGKKLTMGTANLVVGFADAIDYIVTGGDKELAGKRREQQMRANETVMEFSKGISSSLGSGDYYNAIAQMGGALAETAPIIGATAAGGLLGAAAVGVSGGGNAYTEALNDPEYGDSIGGRVGYAIASGVGDFLFAAVGNQIFKTASKASQAATASAQRARIISGQKVTKQAMAAYARRKGLAFAAEGFEEAATEIMTSVVEAMGKGKELDMAETMEAALDAFLIGGVAGVGFQFSGSIHGQSKAMLYARANESATAAVRAEQNAEKLIKEAETTEDPAKKRKLLMLADGLKRDAERARAARQAFYDMLQVRHKDSADTLMGWDVEIETLARQLEDESLSPEAKKAIQEQLEAKVKQRVDLERTFSEESLELTAEERDTLFEDTRKFYRANLDEEIELAQMAVDEHVDRQGTEAYDPEARRIAEDNLRKKKEQRDEFDSLVKELQDAQKEVEETAATEGFEQTDLDQKNADVEAAMEALADQSGLSPKAFGGVGQVGAFLDVQDQITMRYSGQWLVDQVQALDNSSLSREDLQGILESDNWAMLTGENPSGVAVGEATNRSFNARAEKWLMDNGLKYHKIVGRYNAGENSFLVEGMTREQAAEFAKLMGQESVAHKDGLVQADGSINLFKGGATYGSEVDTDSDFMSVIKDKDGNVISFSFMPSGTFQDSEGNTITEEDYSQRAADNSVDAKDIEALMKEEIAKMAKEPKTETEPTSAGEIPSGAVMTPTTKDGNPNWRAGESGVQNADQARALNRLSKFASKLGMKVAVYPDEETAKQYNGSDSWGGIFDMNTRTIHLNPARVKKNQLVETQLGFSRTKSFEETIAEEVLHAVIGPALNRMYAKSPKALNKITQGILKTVEKSDPALYERMISKAQSYSGSNSEMVVLEEVIIEFMSALVADPKSVSVSTIDKMRLVFNTLLTSVGAGLKLKDVNSVLSAARAYDLARTENGFDVTAARIMDREQSRASERKSDALIPPHKLKPGKDGKLRITMEETFYKYDIGFKKDIGSDTVTKTFNDQWHFINWWKKATNMGEDTHYFAFETEDGQTIDVDRIKNYKSSRSSEMLPMNTAQGRNADTRSMINAAVKQGIISRTVAARAFHKLKALENRAERYESRGEDNPFAKKEVERSKMFNEHMRGMLDRAAEQLNKEFNYGGDEVSRASNVLNAKASYPYMGERTVEVAEALQTMTGIKMIEEDDRGNKIITRSPAFLRFVHAHVIKDMMQMNPLMRSEEALASVMSEVVNDPKYVSTFITAGSDIKDPSNYFSSYSSEAKRRVEDMISKGKIPGSLKDNLNRLNFIVSLTSPQNEADTNIQTALEILEASYNVKGKNPSDMIGFEVIDYILNGKADGIKIDRSKIPYTRRSIASLLEKFDALIKSGQDFQELKGVPGSIKRALVEEVKQNGPFIDGAGNVDWDRVMEFLMTPYEGRSKNTRDMVFAHKVFSVKVGPWLLNLSSNLYPDMKNSRGEGMLDLVTVDTHALNVTSLYKGEFADIQGKIAQSIAPLKRALNRHYETDKYLVSTTGFSSDGELNSLIEDGESVIASIDAKIEDNLNGEAEGKDIMSKEDIESARKKIRSLARAIETAKNHPSSKSASSLKKSREMISGAAKMLGVPPAVLQQYVFADSRIMRNGLGKVIVTKKGTVPGEAMLPSHYKTYGNVLAEMNEGIEPGPQHETRSSQLLLFGPESKQTDVESPLYRRRSPEEALAMRDGKMMTNKLVDDALSTDATSRRIMAKDATVNQGQKVGIRLNLNVMKNTGVPVQTMHDKTASGEALRYAPAVMVKNPTLFVNQNARRKIVTFQENKFPMASVNGEFLSDQLDQMNFNGVKAFFNPFKHNVFVDASGRPIKSAGEATIVGNTVYLRGEIEYYEYNDPVLDMGRSETQEQLEKRVKRGPKYDKAISRFEAFSKRSGVEFADRAELEEAYDNMPIESKVALDNSEVSSNMEDAQRRASSMLKIRQTAGKSARRYGGEVRKQILANPRNYFTPQVLKELKAELSDKSDSELIDIMSNEGLGRLQDRNDDLGVLASAELINRAVARGDLEAIPGIIEEAAAMGTTAGRILRHLRELKSSSPKGIESIIKSAVEQRGNRLTDEQTSRLQDMAGNLFRLQAEHEDLVRRAIAGEDVDAELKAKTDEVKDAERKLDTFANGVIERGWGQIGTMLIQGNLLTPMSQITNVGANLINAIGKVAVDAIALPVERMINMFGIESPMKRNYSINAYMYGIRKFGAGFVEALDGIITGQEKDVSEWRVHRGFAPFRSLMSAVGKGDLPMGPDGKAPLQQRMKLFVQGTLGIPAEVMFRFLSLGDVPFRRAVEGIELYHAGRAQGLEGDALAQFIKHPTKKARQEAEREGRKLTYQEQTGASKAAEDAVAFFERMFTKAFDWIPGADGRAMAKFLIRSNLPYVRTPANILIDTLTYVSPYIAGPRIMKNLQNGDAREAAQNFGKLVVGSMVSQTAVMLLKEGLISGAIEWDEDEEKNLAYDQFPPNSINVTGLKRFMSGGSSAKQPDDVFISYTKLGVMGAIMGAIVKGADKEELKKRDYSGLNFPIHALQDSFGVGAFSSIAYMMDQSFMQGMNTLVDVISSADATDFEKNFENWFRTTFQAVSATAFPNTLSAMYRGTREYLPDTRITKDMDLGERLVQRMAYTIKDRTFGLGDVPVRVNWKGEPIKQTPRGNNGIAYQLFDITKSRQGEADPVSNEIYRLYEQTEDLTKVIGTPGYAEKRKMNVPNIKKKHLGMLRRMNKTYTWVNDDEFMAERVYLNTDQMNRLMEASGKERYKEVEAFMATARYDKMDDEEKIEALNKIADNYNSAIEIHNGQFRNHTKVLFDILQEVYENER